MIVVIIFMLWRGNIWPGSQVQTLVLWDKGISECELWSKVKSSCSSILASWAKTEIFCLLAHPLSHHTYFPHQRPNSISLPIQSWVDIWTPHPPFATLPLYEIRKFSNDESTQQPTLWLVTKSPRMMFIDCGTATFLDLQYQSESQIGTFTTAVVWEWHSWWWWLG